MTNINNPETLVVGVSRMINIVLCLQQKPRPFPSISNVFISGTDMVSDDHSHLVYIFWSRLYLLQHRSWDCAHRGLAFDLLLSQSYSHRDQRHSASRVYQETHKQHALN